MPPVEFEPTISAGERPQAYALDRAATGTSRRIVGYKIRQHALLITGCILSIVVSNEPGNKVTIIFFDMFLCSAI